jgi:hypothetical protein
MVFSLLTETLHWNIAAFILQQITGDVLIRHSVIFKILPLFISVWKKSGECFFKKIGACPAFPAIPD